MAIAITTPQPGKFGWIINATSADASGCEELKAAVAGKSIIVDHLTINNGAGQDRRRGYNGLDRAGGYGSEYELTVGLPQRHSPDSGNEFDC